MKRAVQFIKSEAVLCAALFLAVLSAFWIKPDREYIGYIDFRTLAILFCLMSIMAGLQKEGVFRYIAEVLLGKVRTDGQLVFILVMLCFFLSMGITNDVALITFVPFTFTVLKYLGQERADRLLVPVVVMQTIAANLGSMLTPVGNPQNLYLYGKAGMSLGQFLGLMAPYTLLAFVLLAVWCLVQELREKGVTLEVRFEERTVLKGREKSLFVYGILFVLSLLTVARLIPYGITLIAVVAALAVMDRQVLKKVDYSLLLTFVGFFVFIGNMGRIPAFCEFLQGVLAGNEVLVCVLASQIISNVPAALLLSGFTGEFSLLLIGTNLGGLGTLIASMASLISYKYVARAGCGKGRYLLYFTVANIGFLAGMILLAERMGVL